LAAVLVAAVVLGAVVWRLVVDGGEAVVAEAPRRGGGERSAVAVETASVARRDLRESRGFTGSLEAESRFEVVARVPGRILQLDLDIGDRVERGQLVARLEDDEFRQQLRQAEAEMEVAEANIAEAESDLRVADRELARIRVLRGRDIAAEVDLEMAEAQRSAADARLRVARGVFSQRQAGVETAQLRVSQTEVRASWEGAGEERAVAERFAHEGGYVSANAPVVSLVNLRTVRAVVFVTERDYGLMRVGQEAEVVVDAFPGESFPARVARVAPVFDTSSRQARVEVEVDNKGGRLAPGMFARVRMGLREAPDVPSVPLDALVRRNGQEGVFLIDPAENVARFVALELGIRAGAWVEVRSPELIGAVVTLGQSQLTSGQAVRVIKAGTGAGGNVRAGR
jgi:HlyD family secretion protein